MKRTYSVHVTRTSKLIERTVVEVSADSASAALGIAEDKVDDQYIHWEHVDNPDYDTPEYDYQVEVAKR